MDLKAHFNDMLTKIRPPQDLLDECVKAHTELREALMSDPELKGIVVTTFLQGSYRRSTLIRPQQGSKADVDVVLVTNLDPGTWSPAQVQERFCKVLEKYPQYRGSYQRQGRSIGLSRGRINLDLVVTAAPSEALRAVLLSDAIGATSSVEGYPEWALGRGQQPAGQDWKREPLLIPDRDANRWEQTDPISQIEWTHDKNRTTDGHYVNVVKLVKWWWAQHSSGKRGVPKGYLVERLVGLHCPDGIESVAEGFTKTLEGIRDTYGADVLQGRTPFIPDIGIPSNNVFKRVRPVLFKEFYGAADTCAAKARSAYDDPNPGTSGSGWATIFGSVFPLTSTGGGTSSGTSSQTFAKPSRPAEPRRARFA